jgi:dihydroorotase
MFSHNLQRVNNLISNLDVIEEIYKAKSSGHVYACKLYPAGATTNSESGVTDIEKVYPTLEAMAKVNMPLLVHGEVTDPVTDVFDKEAVFIERHLKPLLKAMPSLKLVMEHITTKDAVDFVMSQPDNVAATITCHHLLYNRNDIFKGGIRPHMYCLPILKREDHRQALLGAIKSGSKKFFLGTDSAPHAIGMKECSAGCAGIYTAPFSLELYAEAFEQVDSLHLLEAFASFNGADFYGLPRNTEKIQLEKIPKSIPPHYTFGDDDVLVKPLRAGESVSFTAIKL